MTDQLTGWRSARARSISWKSQDGADDRRRADQARRLRSVEEVPAARAVIHGGPTGIDRPTLLDTRYYPTDIWVGRGALVLKVNYRGSAGYGEKFRQLNVRNLGVGDAWDVLSGVDHLVAKGWVDPEARRRAWAGARAATSRPSSPPRRDRFAAISVGAGISNWATYYYNTDITPFTIQYLGDDPADDPEIYRKTSPMTYVEAGEDADAHPARRERPPRADPERLRAAAGPRGPRRAGARWSSTRASATASRSRRPCAR